MQMSMRARVKRLFDRLTKGNRRHLWRRLRLLHDDLLLLFFLQAKTPCTTPTCPWPSQGDWLRHAHRKGLPCLRACELDAARDRGDFAAVLQHLDHLETDAARRWSRKG